MQPTPKVTSTSSPLDQAQHEARRLGHRNFGPPHVILAVLRGRDCVAKRALLATGVTPDGFESRFAAAYRDNAAPPERWVASTPSFLAVQAAARAFAAVGNRVEPDAADAVLGVLYADAWTYGPDDSQLPSRLVAALRERGVTAPPVPPPERRPWRSPCSTEVQPELMDTVIRLLLREYPRGDGPQWGFNAVDDGRQFISYEAELDLAPIVAEAERIHDADEDARSTP